MRTTWIHKPWLTTTKTENPTRKGYAKGPKKPHIYYDIEPKFFFDGMDNTATKYEKEFNKPVIEQMKKH